MKDTTVHDGFADQSAFDPKASDVRELRVELDGEAAREFGASIGVLKLAANALSFWEGHV